MISKERVSEFKDIIESMIKANAENMVNSAIDTGKNMDPSVIECLGRIKNGEEMLRVVEKYLD